MNKIKCSACGGNLKINENQNYVTCPYCGTTYQINEDLNVNVNIGDINVKLDENAKDLLLNTNHKYTKNVSRFILIPFLIIFLIIVFSIFSMIKNNSNNFDIKRFNSKFEILNGTQNIFFVENLLDDVVTNNKTNKKHMITVIYQGNKLIDSDEIVDIKHSLKNNEYEISFDYDKKGYINKVFINEL